MSDSWWSKRLGGDAPAPRQQPSTPPTQSPRWQPQPADEQENWAGAGGAGASIPNAQVHIGDALSGVAPVITRGDKAAQEVAMGKVDANCPECGSGNYFSRSAGMVRGPAPAPHCHDCGYPIVQAGSGTGTLGGGGVRSAGPARTAPQIAYGNPANYGT